MGKPRITLIGPFLVHFIRENGLLHRGIQHIQLELLGLRLPRQAVPMY